MERTNGQPTGPSPEAFRSAFDKVQGLIREEWPAVDAESLQGTGGDVEKVIELVAARTEHTKAKVRRQLAELQDLVEPKGTLRELEETLRRLERKTREVTERVREALPEARQKVSENLWVSLLVALGLGLILGLLLRGRGRG